MMTPEQEWEEAFAEAAENGLNCDDAAEFADKQCGVAS